MLPAHPLPETAIFAHCTTSGADPACGTDPSATCDNDVIDGYPGGYCSYEPCSVVALCPLGSSCGKLGGENPACFKDCTTDADCVRTPADTPAYKCQPMDQLYVSGAARRVCYVPVMACGKSADCPTTFPTCMGASGSPPSGGTCQ